MAGGIYASADGAGRGVSQYDQFVAHNSFGMIKRGAGEISDDRRSKKKSM